MALCREQTKLHEEVHQGTVTEVLASLEGAPLRGRGGHHMAGDLVGAVVDVAAAVAEARALADAGARKRDAAHTVAELAGDLGPTRSIARCWTPRRTLRFGCI